MKGGLEIIARCEYARSSICNYIHVVQEKSKKNLIKYQELCQRRNIGFIWNLLLQSFRVAVVYCKRQVARSIILTVQVGIIDGLTLLRFECTLAVYGILGSILYETMQWLLSVVDVLFKLQSHWCQVIQY